MNSESIRAFLSGAVYLKIMPDVSLIPAKPIFSPGRYNQ